MFVRSIVFSLILFIYAVSGTAVAEVIVPTEEQTILLRGSAEVRQGVRAVTGSVDATGHGPITYYTIPFQRGTFLFRGKAATKTVLPLSLTGKPMGKPPIFSRYM